MSDLKKITDNDFPALWELALSEKKKTIKSVFTAKTSATVLHVFWCVLMVAVSCMAVYHWANAQKLECSDFGVSLLVLKIGEIVHRLVTYKGSLIGMCLEMLFGGVVTSFFIGLLVRTLVAIFYHPHVDIDGFGTTDKRGATCLLDSLKYSSMYRGESVADVLDGTPFAVYLIHAALVAIPLALAVLLPADNYEALQTVAWVVFLTQGIVLVLATLLCWLPCAGIFWVSSHVCGWPLKQSARLQEQRKALQDYIEELNKQEKAQKAKEEAKRKRQKEQEEAQRKKQKAQEAYEKAIKGDKINEGYMFEAANLGHVEACLYIGKKWLESEGSAMFTKEEKESRLKKAGQCFEILKNNTNKDDKALYTEYEYLCLHCRLRTTKMTKSQWKELLQDLRFIRNGGLLADEYLPMMESDVEAVVEVIDQMAREEQEATPQPTYTKFDCKFRNGAICTKQSTSYFVYHCNYVNNPASCYVAQQAKALTLV